MKTVNLPNLNETVLAALNFFAGHRPPQLDLSRFSLPFVIGSGNAYNTAQIMFSGQPAIFANESNFLALTGSYRQLIKNKTIKEAIIISASGEKDSVWEIKLAKKLGLKTTLLTCSPQSEAAKLADKAISFHRLPEPYTYNVSTYLGMILAVTGENPKKIAAILRKISIPKNFAKYQAYAFILPDKAGSVVPMLEIKRHELFGARLSIRAFSQGEARHAKFVNAWDKELAISFGPNKHFGCPKQRWEIKGLKEAPAGLAMAAGYYLIGAIQASKPQYFKQNISKFCQVGPKAYGEKKPFPIVVPGSN